MRIVIICEGKTEAALKNNLREFVNQRTPGPKVKIDCHKLNGHIRQKTLCTSVENYSIDADVLGIVVLTDVYKEYTDAADAKKQLAEYLGGLINEKVRIHVAQFEVEAWLIPHWDKICEDLRKDLRQGMKCPSGEPEKINSETPPSFHFKELFKRAGRHFEKPVVGPKYLTADGLAKAAQSCPELKLFLDSLLEFARSSKPL